MKATVESWRTVLGKWWSLKAETNLQNIIFQIFVLIKVMDINEKFSIQSVYIYRWNSQSWKVLFETIRIRLETSKFCCF